MINSNNLPDTNKSRSLTLKQLFEILQEEYIVYELRAKIYPEKHVNLEGKVSYHKAYWTDLMNKKKQKIVDIAKKNVMFSIFDDKRIKQDYEKRVIPEVGFPNFIYKDDPQRLLQEKWDIHNYYAIDSEVKVYDNKNSKTVLGSIKRVNFVDSLITVELPCGNNFEFSLDLVTRVL